MNLTVDGVGKESVAYLCWQAGYDDYCLTSSFYELMQEDPDDVRNQAYTVVPKTKRAYIAKYQPQSGKAVEDSNIPVLRLSELYLIAAEAWLAGNRCFCFSGAGYRIDCTFVYL